MVPALAAVRAEKAALRMIAAESAIFVTLDIVLSPSFVRRRVATASAQVTIRSGSATAEIGCPNRRLKYRLDIVSMPQRYRAAVRRFLWIGSRLRDCVAFGVAATS